MTEEKPNYDKTYQYDESLPALPVPNLESTLIKYLNSIEFLLNDKEYETVVETIKQFKQEPGEILQKKLEEKAKSNKNWVRSFLKNLFMIFFLDRILTIALI